MKYTELSTMGQIYVETAVRNNIDKKCPGYGKSAKEKVLKVTLGFMELDYLTLNVIEELVISLEKNNNMRHAGNSLVSFIEKDMPISNKSTEIRRSGVLSSWKNYSR